METKKQTNTIQVGWIGYVAFFAAILLFSGIFSSSEGPWKVLDFNVLNGSFGKIQGASSSFTFRGANGTGARDGFLFALELIPAVILALGLVNVVDGPFVYKRGCIFACISQHLNASVTVLLSCDAGDFGRTQLNSGDEICCCHNCFIYYFTIYCLLFAAR